MLSRVRQCSLRTSQAFQLLSSKPLPNQYKLFPSLQPQAQSLFSNPRFYFADTVNETKQDVPPVQNQETQPETEVNEKEKENVEEIRESFVDYMKRKITSEDMIYEYSNPVVYLLHEQATLINLRGARKTMSGGTFVFGGIAVYVALNFSVWLAILPALCGMTMFATKLFTNNIWRSYIEKIELVDPYNIKIYPYYTQGRGILCDIKKTQVKGIHIKDMEGKPAQVYVVEVSFVESVTGRKHKNKWIPIDATKTTIDNVDLFKCIVYGRADEVAKFRLVKEKDSFADLFETSTEQETLKEKETSKEKESEMNERGVGEAEQSASK